LKGGQYEFLTFEAYLRICLLVLEMEISWKEGVGQLILCSYRKPSVGRPAVGRLGVDAW
jgi:hypothetical protein